MVKQLLRRKVKQRTKNARNWVSLPRDPLCCSCSDRPHFTQETPTKLGKLFELSERSMYQCKEITEKSHRLLVLKSGSWSCLDLHVGCNSHCKVSCPNEVSSKAFVTQSLIQINMIPSSPHPFSPMLTYQPEGGQQEPQPKTTKWTFNDNSTSNLTKGKE